MTDEYIENHFNEIIAHESDIESRWIKADCTSDELKKSNRRFIDTFGSAGEEITLIKNDYNRSFANLME